MAKNISQYPKDIKRYNLEVVEIQKKRAHLAAQYTRSIAPRKSGALIQGISYASSSGARGVDGKFIRTGSVISRTPENINNSNPRNAPYHVYLENGKRVNVRNGRVQRYMKATSEWINEHTGDDVSRVVLKVF